MLHTLCYQINKNLTTNKEEYTHVNKENFYIYLDHQRLYN